MSDTPRTDAAILTEPFQVRTLNFEVVAVDFASQLERELAASQVGQAELLARLEEARTSHLHAAARDVQTIQQQAVELAKWQSVVEAMAGKCSAIAFGDIFDDTMRRYAKQALAAYKAAKSANHD